MYIIQQGEKHQQADLHSVSPVCSHCEECKKGTGCKKLPGWGAKTSTLSNMTRCDHDTTELM